MGKSIEIRIKLSDRIFQFCFCELPRVLLRTKNKKNWKFPSGETYSYGVFVEIPGFWLEFFWYMFARSLSFRGEIEGSSFRHHLATRWR